MPGTLFDFVLEVENGGAKSRCVSPLEVQTVPAKSWHGAQDIKRGGNSARDCNGNYVMMKNLEIKVILGIKIKYR